MLQPKRGVPWKLLLVASIGLLLVVAVAAVLLFDPIVRFAVASQARSRGVELDCTTVELSLGSLKLGDCRFRLVGVRGVSGKLASASVVLDGLEPSRIEAAGVDVDAEGSAATVALDLGMWTKSHPGAFRLPVVASKVGLVYRSQQGGQPWLVVENGSIAPGKAGGAFQAASAQVAGIPVGSVAASWTATASTVTLGFGKDSPEAAPLRIDVQHALPQPTATVTLQPTPLDDLGGPLGVKLPVQGASASGTASLVLQRRAIEGVIEGRVKITLDGWTPPHPRELDAFVFGKKTTFETRVHVSEDRRTVTLSDAKVKAGAFALGGKGSLRRQTGYALVDLSLTGNIPCGDLAAAAAQTRLGPFAGIAGSAARLALSGSVGVTVVVAADTRDLAAAKITRSIGIGCGLKPLGLPLLDVPDLPDLPKDLPLPQLPKDLPLPF